MSIKRLLKPLFAVAVIGFILTGGYAVLDKVKSSSFFTITSVEVKGVINSDRDEITKISNKVIGLNIFDDKLDDMLISDDPWVQKIVANRILPGNISLLVFEEKPLFAYKLGSKCFIYSSSDKHMSTGCSDVLITIDAMPAHEEALALAAIMDNAPELKQAEILLKNRKFEANMGDRVLYCPYDEKVFKENYDLYTSKIRSRYKRVEYVDLTISERIFVKGEQNVANKG